MPRAGMAILYAMCKEYFAEKMTIGRDQCYDIFRANGLTLRTSKKPRTTNSNHNFYIYPDLLNTTPKLVATHFGELVAKAVDVYNNIRPHQALGMKTPASALKEMLQ